MTDPIIRVSDSSTQIKIVQTWAGLISQFMALVLFAGTGAYLIRVGIHSEPHNMKLIYSGMGGILLGGLCLPSIFPIVKNIYITILPNGLPLFGGQRKGDPAVQILPNETSPTTEIKV